MSRSLFVVAVVAALAAPAAAQPAPANPPESPAPSPTDADRPWAEGVSPAEQEAALALFRAGNDAFAHLDYATAEKLYREALSHWDHPAISGNLAVTLVHLDDPVGAYERVEHALRYGDAPFDDAVFRRLETDKKLLEGQLGHVEVTCDVPDAVVSIDGETVLVGVGAYTRTVRAGSYQVVASKPNYLTYTNLVTALPDEPVAIQVQLLPLDQAGGWERRWATWKPWAVLGAGAAVAAIGLGYELAAQGSVDDYEAYVALECASGCTTAQLPGPVRDLEGRAATQNKLGVTGLVVGAAAVVAGGVMVYLNQPTRVRLEESGRRVGAAPVVTPDGAGVAVFGRF